MRRISDVLLFFQDNSEKTHNTVTGPEFYCCMRVQQEKTGASSSQSGTSGGPGTSSETSSETSSGISSGTLSEISSCGFLSLRRQFLEQTLSLCDLGQPVGAVERFLQVCGLLKVENDESDE